MTVPVVKALAMARPDIHIIMVSRPFAKAFYEGLAPNVEFVGINLKDSRYKGINGLRHVYHDLRALKPDMVADLHDVLRTKYARLRFRVAGIPVSYIDKNRAARKEITRREDKILMQQALPSRNTRQCSAGWDWISRFLKRLPWHRKNRLPASRKRLSA